MLVCLFYNPNKNNISRHFEALRKSLDSNVRVDNPYMESFYESDKFNPLMHNFPK